MKKNIYICITESLAVHQKLTQHCKSTILQLKKKKKRKRSTDKSQVPWKYN